MHSHGGLSSWHVWHSFHISLHTSVVNSDTGLSFSMHVPKLCRGQRWWHLQLWLEWCLCTVWYVCGSWLDGRNEGVVVVVVGCCSASVRGEMWMSIAEGVSSCTWQCENTTAGQGVRNADPHSAEVKGRIFPLGHLDQKRMGSQWKREWIYGVCPWILLTFTDRMHLIQVLN